MTSRYFRKSIKAITVYGFGEFVKRTFIFFDRSIRPDKYFHFEVGVKKYSKKNILFISGEPKNATSYYRCDIPKLQLEKFGWSVDIVFESFVNKVNIRLYEIIIFYRTPLNEMNQKVVDWAKKNEKILIFSVDDFVYRRDLLEELDYVDYLDKDDADRLLERADGMTSLMQQCDYGLASTNYLADNMKKYIKGEVFVSRNGILKDDRKVIDLIDNKEHNQSKKQIILGYYSGSETHDRDLQLIWPSLKRILNKFEYVQLNVGGRINFDFGKYNNKVNKLPFMPRSEFTKALANTDINLLPLEDTEFNRGKSEIKFIEAALVQVPTIASAVGDMRSIIKPEFGVLVKGDNDWYDELKKLILDVTLRKSTGNMARDYVVQDYNLNVLGEQISKFLIKIKI